MQYYYRDRCMDNPVSRKESEAKNGHDREVRAAITFRRTKKLQAGCSFVCHRSRALRLLPLIFFHEEDTLSVERNSTVISIKRLGSQSASSVVLQQHEITFQSKTHRCRRQVPDGTHWPRLLYGWKQQCYG
jgi:hypothetical protein